MRRVLSRRPGVPRFLTGGGGPGFRLKPALRAAVVGVPDFARGPSQAVNVPANVIPPNGIPLRLLNGAGVDSIDRTLRYDPALLTITGAALGSAVPANAQLIVNNNTPGPLILAFSSPTPLSAAAIDFVTLTAQVPASVTASYTAKHLLDITNLMVNEGAVVARDADKSLDFLFPLAAY